MSQLTVSRNIGRISIGHVFAIATIVTPLMAAYAPKGMAPLLIVIALLSGYMTISRQRIRKLLKQPAFRLFVLFVFFAALSSLWSPNLGLSLYASVILGSTGCGGFIIAWAGSTMTGHDRHIFERGLIIGGLMGLSLLLVEYLTGGAGKNFALMMLNGGSHSEKSVLPTNSSGIAIFALFFWPWLYVIYTRFRLIFAATILTSSIFVIQLDRTNTPLLAVLLGILFCVLCIRSKKFSIILATTALITGIAIAPVLPRIAPDPVTETEKYSYLSNSAIHRLLIWRTAADRLTERPFSGFGMNSVREMYSSKDRRYVVFNAGNPNSSWYNWFEPIPLHVHNGILQIWVELGIGGAALLAGFMLCIIRAVSQLPASSSSAAFSLGLLITAIVIFCSSFGPWQSWWQSALWLLGGLMTVVVSKDRDEDPAK